MFAAGKTAAVSGAAPDGQFNYVTMLLHGDGTNGAQNNTFLDSSTNNFTITRNGNTTQGSFSPYGSNWSNYFDGTGDYLTTSSSQIIQTGSFTVECFVFITGSGNNQKFVSQGTSGTAGRFSVGIEGGNWWVQLGSDAVQTGTPVRNQWNYVAATFNGSTLSLYVNGSLISSVSTSTNAQNTTLTIGQDWNSYTTTGYISNVRVSNTVRTVTTTPTAPFTSDGNTRLLACQANRFLDSSANAFALTVNGNPSVQRFNPFGASTAYSTSVIGGSGYFDGTGDSLTIAASSAFAFGSGNFSVQFWVYFTAATGDNQTVVELRPMRLIIGRKTTNKARIYVPNTDQNNGDNGPIIPNNAWTHFSVARTGTTMYVYINGVSAFSFSSTDTFNSNPSISIGRNDDLAEPMIGYVSDVRILKGTYDVTLPTAPYTAITNTSLLLSMTNGAIFDNAMMNDLETVGNAQISTSVKKYGTGSLAFDGTGDYLLGASNPNMSFGAGDFTVEAWVYTQGTSGNNQTIFQKGRGGDSNLEFAMSLNGSNQLTCFYTTDGSTIVQPVASSNTVSLSTWTHVAISRSGSTWRCFVDGTLRGSDTYSATLYTGTGVISSGANPVGDNPYTGYIDDLRVTKGYARYTTTFTPPTSALSDTGPY